MITKTEVESILRLNGVPVTAPDDMIKTVLQNANLTAEEADYAIQILRLPSDQLKQSDVTGLHKLFRTDQSLRPDEIVQLLGIEVEHTDEVVPQGKARAASPLQMTLVWILSAIFALAGILLYMYANNVGVFHPSAKVSIHR